MEPQDVHLFIFDSLSDWEPGFAIAGINNPQFQRNPGNYRVRTVALTKDSVLTMGGIRILPDMTLDDLSPAKSAMLILPGGISWDRGENGEAVEMAALFLNAGVPVAAICGATAGLAHRGLLDHRRHTSNSSGYLVMTQYRGATLYEDAPAVTDDNLITASGIAPVDFALHIFQRLDLYTPPVMDAWYGLFKTGQPEYFEALMHATKAYPEKVG
jgi:putative intracellular protease/amidase